MFEWFKTSKHGTVLTEGTISVEEDGSLVVMPYDDYYTGDIKPEEAKRLALAILERTGGQFP